MFVTVQGHPLTILRRAIASGNATVAWAAAQEYKGIVDLADAASLCLLQVGVEPRRFARAAPRLHARICVEHAG